MRPDVTILAVVLAVLLASMIPFAARIRGRGAPSPGVERHSFLVGDFLAGWFYWLMGPAERAALALGLGPFFFNALGLLLGLMAGVAFATGHTTLAGWCVLCGGIADIFDGKVARTLGVVSPAGAFIDSTFDRFSEAAAFVGLTIALRDSALAVAAVTTALGGSLLVSYARARGESLGVTCRHGIMQRQERVLLLGFAALLDPATTAWLGWPQGTVLTGAVALLATGAVGTSIYRTWWISRRLAATRD